MIKAQEVISNNCFTTLNPKQMKRISFIVCGLVLAVLGVYTFGATQSGLPAASSIVTAIIGGVIAAYFIANDEPKAQLAR